MIRLSLNFLLLFGGTLQPMTVSAVQASIDRCHAQNALAAVVRNPRQDIIAVMCAARR